MNVVDFKRVLPATVLRAVFLLGITVSLVACGGGDRGETDAGNPYQGNPGFSDTNTPEVTCADLSCDDGDPCTLPSCEDAECTYEPSVGTLCDDGNACSLEDECSDDGLCVGATSLVCEDDKTCTDDTCDTKTGCVFVDHEDGYPCTDGDPCTLGDGCAHGLCSGSPKSCPDDDNSCTVNAGCEPETGDCLTQVVPDGNVCDDDNLCTSDDCDPAEGCTHEDTSLVTCDDLNDCTSDS